MIVPFELAARVDAILDNVRSAAPPWLTLTMAITIEEFEPLMKQHEPSDN